MMLSVGDRPGPPRSTLATVVRCIARTLDAEFGIAPQRLLAEVGIPPDVLQDDELRLPLPDLSRLWRRCEEATKEPSFGMRVARHVVPGDVYGIDLALYTSSTLEEAVRRFAQFLALLTTVSVGQFRQDADGDWHLGYEVASECPPTDSARDFFIFAQIHLFERQCHLSAPQFLRRIELTRTAPADCATFQSLGVDVVFDQPASGMLFKGATWQRPLLGANPQLLAQVEQPILEYLARLGAPLPLSALRARLVDRLAEPPSAAAFAQRLGMTRLQLEQSLLDQHVTFAQLLDQTREIQALRLLATPDLSLDQVSLRVGYRNTSSLIRAFRRWRGITPASYRKQCCSRDTKP